MFEIKAKSQFLDLSKSLKGLYVIAFGVFMSVLSYLVYRNLIVTVTLATSAILSYTFLSKPPQEVVINIQEDALKLNETEVPWGNITGWAVVNLGKDIEIVINTVGIIKDYYYFYISHDNPDINKFLESLAQMAIYNPEIVKGNQAHKFFRTFGLK